MAVNENVTIHVGARTDKFLGGMNKVKLAMAAVGAAVAVGIKKTIDSAAKFETIQVRFETLTGSAEKASRHMKELLEFSAKTPFQFEDLANASATLQAFGTELGDVQGQLRQIGDVAAATGQPLKEIAVVYGQVAAAGRLTGERLLQFQERGVPILKAVVKQFGTTTGEVQKLVRQGKVTNEVFQRAFRTLSEKGGMAFGGMEKQKNGGK